MGVVNHTTLMSILEKKQQIEIKRQQIAQLKAEISVIMAELQSERFGLLDDFRVTCVRLDNLDILGE
jgi:hypothetical protein